MKTLGAHLDRMAAFVAVADAGSFTGAAERLDMTKSALSQSVATLEREIGSQLLLRSTRKLTLTEAGRAFLDESRSLLQQAEATVERARTGRARPSGLLRLTTAADSAAMVAPLIAEYTTRFPDMRVEYLPTDRIVDLIAERFDLALRTGAMRDSRLRGVKLATFRMMTVATPAYLARHGTPKHPRDLANHAWIGLSALDTPWSRTYQSRDGKNTPVRFRGNLSVATAAGVKSLCLCDAGIAAFPDFMVEEDIAARRLIRLLPGFSLPDIYLFAVWAGTMEPPAKTRAFIELAKSHLRR
jgi:DNA-binding transcriptional LysR family regulator